MKHSVQVNYCPFHLVMSGTFPHCHGNVHVQHSDAHEAASQDGSRVDVSGNLNYPNPNFNDMLEMGGVPISNQSRWKY